MEQISEKRLSDLIFDVEYLLPTSNPKAVDMARALHELQQRRAQTCATCAAWEPFSDDPVFAADEDLWCAELERYKPAAGYCDCWRAKEADDGRESICPDCNGQGWVSFGIDGASCSKCGGRGWNG